MKNLHNVVASVVTQFCHIHTQLHPVFAPECGGSHRLPLFAADFRCRERNYCWVDACIIGPANTVLAVIEIEQSGVPKPCMFGSKYLPVAMSHFLNTTKTGVVQLASDLTLIHVINTHRVKPGSKKLLQYENIATDIQSLGHVGSVAAYDAIAGTIEQFENGGAPAERLNRALQRTLAFEVGAKDPA